MSKLRRAMGRKEVILGLLLFLFAGCWFSWQHLVQPASAQPQLPQDEPPATQPAQAQVDQSELTELNALLDSGQYAEVVTRADTLTEQVGNHSGVLRCKTVAEASSGNPHAQVTADTVISVSPTGADAAAALSVKALQAVRGTRVDLAAAQEDAVRAGAQAGGDPQADLLARVARAAVKRREATAASLQLSPPQDPAALLATADDIRQTLQPLYNQMPTEPEAAWQKKAWRQGLALLVDACVLVAQAGDAAGESAALATMRQSCPADAWGGVFGTPDKALAAVQAGVLGDHSRVAMLAAISNLYLDSGDRRHADMVLRRAIQAYGRLLESYDGWSGEQVDTVTPNRVFKKVGSEFYLYRNRMDRLVKYSADWWGARVLRAEVPMAEALALCEQPLFRAIVRVRAERETDPIRILREERVKVADYSTVADWFRTRAHPLQTDWEHQRAELIDQIGQQESKAEDALREGGRLMAAGRPREVLALLDNAKETEPTLVETRLTLRLTKVQVLLSLREYEEADVLLAECEPLLAADDGYASIDPLFYLGAMRVFAANAAADRGDYEEAIRLAADGVEAQVHPLRCQMYLLGRIVEWRMLRNQPTQAQEALARLQACPAGTDEERQDKEYFAQAAESWLRAGYALQVIRPQAAATQASEPASPAN